MLQLSELESEFEDVSARRARRERHGTGRTRVLRVENWLTFRNDLAQRDAWPFRESRIDDQETPI